MLGMRAHPGERDASPASGAQGRPTDRGERRGLVRAVPTMPTRLASVLTWPVIPAAGLLGGLIASALGAPDLADALWTGIIVLTLVSLSIDVVRDLVHRNPGVDLIALLAMAGALLLAQLLAGAIIALMLASGRALEDYACTRARRELSALLQHAPRVAHRVETRTGSPTDAPIADVDADEVERGDLLLVKPGEVVPADGVVDDDVAVLDESTLTGEARPVRRARGDRVASGVVNAAGPFRLRAVAAARDSTYAGIIALVRQAEASKAPSSRLADRYALVFVPVTLVIAALAWLASGDPVRAFAVIVVATPCPLILAVPVAIVSGISRAARRGIVVKDAASLEALAGVRVVLFDKTGTLTAGNPQMAEVVAFGGQSPEEALRLAASLDQVSAHVFAAPIVAAARSRGLPLTFPDDVVERLGAGIEGIVEGRRVGVGSARWLTTGRPTSAAVRAVRRRAALEGATVVFVAVDSEPVAALLLDDPIRIEAPRAVRALYGVGVQRTIMLTGDRTDVAEVVAAATGVREILAERSPVQKVEAVRDLAATGDHGVLMVGDGVNDAPALAAADVGVAMGARGATASSESADVVITVDRLDRLPEAVGIARRSRAVAVQSVLLGMGLSFVGMGAAAVGLLAPVAGALLQEGIDVAAIANALRALHDPRRTAVREGPAGEAARVSARFQQAHCELQPALERLRTAADRLDDLGPIEAVEEMERIRRFLSDTLVPHEREEEAAFRPATAGGRGLPSGGGILPVDANLADHLGRSHAEIERLSRHFDVLVSDLGPEGPTAEDRTDLRRVLYGLHAVLRLHLAQEEDLFLEFEGA